jgi:hypothetical protein
MRIRMRWAAAPAALATAALFVLTGVAGANVPLTLVSADPYTNTTS